MHFYYRLLCNVKQTTYICIVIKKQQDNGSTKVQQSKNHEIRLVNVQGWQEVPQSCIDVQRMPKRGLEGRKKFL